MRKILFIATFTTALLTSVLSQATLLTFEPGSLALEGVNLNKTAQINDSKGQPTQLSMDLLGAGLRSKTVLFVAAKVYIAQLFSDNAAEFQRNDAALSSLVTHSKYVAMKISMLRTVSAATLAVSFREAIQANGYDIDQELTQLLNIVEQSADATQGGSLTMLMTRNAQGGTNIYYEDVNGAQKSFVGSVELMTKVMAIWLGKPADAGLANLKASLIKSVY